MKRIAFLAVSAVAMVAIVRFSPLLHEEESLLPIKYEESPEHLYPEEREITCKESKDLVQMTIRAAKRGEADAQNSLAGHYETGDCMLKDLGKALLWYQKSAEKEYFPSMARLVSFYSYGMGTEKNPEKVLFWMEKLAKRQSSCAQFGLGSKYAEGDGTKIDLRKAVYWFQESAKNKNPLALTALADIFYTGEYFNQDYAMAFEYYKKAAEVYSPDATYMLGNMYKNGEGIHQNLYDSYFWYFLTYRLAFLEIGFSLSNDSTTAEQKFITINKLMELITLSINEISNLEKNLNKEQKKEIGQWIKSELEKRELLINEGHIQATSFTCILPQYDPMAEKLF